MQGSPSTRHLLEAQSLLDLSKESQYEIDCIQPHMLHMFLGRPICCIAARDNPHLLPRCFDLIGHGHMHVVSTVLMNQESRLYCHTRRRASLLMGTSS